MNAPSNSTVLPRSIPEYLDQLRAALAGADPALVQDALYDAEEYLRSELSERPDTPEAEVIASVAGSYGAPHEVVAVGRHRRVLVPGQVDHPGWVADVQVLDLHAHVDEQRVRPRLQLGPGFQGCQLFHRLQGTPAFLQCAA